LHPLRGPRRSRHNLARDCGPRLLIHAAMSSRPIAKMVRALTVIRCVVHTFKTAPVRKPFLSSTSRSSRSRCSAI
jgi:hypothetical protein